MHIESAAVDYEAKYTQHIFHGTIQTLAVSQTTNIADQPLATRASSSGTTICR